MSKIIEIKTLKQLFELSTMAGGSVAGSVEPTIKQDEEMKRQDIVTEQKLRSYIRSKINESYKKQRTQQLNEEAKLRQVIDPFLKSLISPIFILIVQLVLMFWKIFLRK